MSTGFGKRRADPLPPPPLPPNGAGLFGGRPPHDGGSDPWRLARIALFAALAGAAVIGLSLGGRMALQSSLEARFDEAVSRPDFGQAPQSNFMFASTDSASPSLENLHAACRSAAKNAMIDRRFYSDSDVSPMAGETGLLRSAAFIACMMETKPTRYCQKEHRADLVNEVREHLGLMRRVKEDWRFQSMPVDFTPGNFANPVLQAWKLQLTPLDSPERADYPSGAVDNRIIEGLRRLAEQGLIGASDFGWLGLALPAELKPAFQHLESKSNRCA